MYEEIEDDNGQAIVLFNIAGTLSKQKEYKLANEYINQAIEK